MISTFTRLNSLICPNYPHSVRPSGHHAILQSPTSNGPHSPISTQNTDPSSAIYLDVKIDLSCLSAQGQDLLNGKLTKEKIGLMHLNLNPKKKIDVQQSSGPASNGTAKRSSFEGEKEQDKETRAPRHNSPLHGSFIPSLGKHGNKENSNVNLQGAAGKMAIHNKSSSHVSKQGSGYAPNKPATQGLPPPPASSHSSKGTAGFSSPPTVPPLSPKYMNSPKAKAAGKSRPFF